MYPPKGVNMNSHVLTLLITAFLVELGGGFDAYAQSGTIIAPVKCEHPNAPSCGDDITVSQAEQSFEKLKSDGSVCLPKSKQGGSNNEEHCSGLESVTDFNVCDEGRTIGLYYYWAPSNQFRDGATVLSSLTHRAQT